MQSKISTSSRQKESYFIKILHRKNGFAKVYKNLSLDIDSKITLLNQNIE